MDLKCGKYVIYLQYSQWMWRRFQVTNGNKYHSDYGEPQCEILHSSYFYSHLSVILWLQWEFTVIVRLWQVSVWRYNEFPLRFSLIVIWELHSEIIMYITLWRVSQNNITMRLDGDSHLETSIESQDNFLSLSFWDS